jgi:hypothetical protein
VTNWQSSIITCQTRRKRTRWHFQRHVERQGLAIEWCHTRRPNDADATHVLACIDHASTAFRNKKLKIQHKNTKTSFITLEITNKLVWNNKNTSKCISFFFFLSFLRIKMCFNCSLIKEKPKIPWSTTIGFFFTLRANKYFYCFKVCEKTKNFWITIKVKT